MNCFRRLYVFCAVASAAFPTTFAGTVDVTLGDHIPGINYKQKPALSFQREGTLFHSELPVSAGESLVKNAAAGQKADKPVSR